MEVKKLLDFLRGRTKTMPKLDNVELIRRLEAQQFPELDSSGRASSGIQQDNISYTYFAPSHHFETGLWNADIIEDIVKNNRKLLSVGAGGGHLERFLVEHGGVNSKQIHLADINLQQLPRGFQRFEFDMFKDWPRELEKYDYIWFPRSVLIPHEDLRTNRGFFYWVRMLRSALAHLEEDGQIRSHTQGLDNTTWLRIIHELNHDPNNAAFSPQLFTLHKKPL